MLPVCLAGCLWLSGSWSVSYLLASDWRSRFRVLFVLLSPSLSLSLSALPCSSPLASGGCSCWLWCLSLLPSTLVLFLVIFLDGCMLVSLRFLGVVFWFHSIPPSWWGPALLFSRGVLPVRSSGSVRDIGWSSWLSPLPAAWLRFVVFSRFPVVWFGASATFHAGPTPGLSSAPWLFHRFLPRVSSVCPLLDSSLLCYLASWLVLGSSFQVLVELGLPPIRCSLFGLMVLP